MKVRAANSINIEAIIIGDSGVKIAAINPEIIEGNNCAKACTDELIPNTLPAISGFVDFESKLPKFDIVKPVESPKNGGIKYICQACWGKK